MPSFDIVCELNQHEVRNAVDQANRELETRFDFKGTDAKFLVQAEIITLMGENELQLKQMLEILNKKLAKRGVDLKHIKLEEPNISLSKAEQEITLLQGIPDDVAKKMIKLFKEQKFKVQASIQGDQVRVTSKSRDELQQVMQFLRQQSLNVPIQFTNFRE